MKKTFLFNIAYDLETPIEEFIEQFPIESLDADVFVSGEGLPLIDEPTLKVQPTVLAELDIDPLLDPQTIAHQFYATNVSDAFERQILGRAYNFCISINASSFLTPHIMESIYEFCQTMVRLEKGLVYGLSYRHYYNVFVSDFATLHKLIHFPRYVRYFSVDKRDDFYPDIILQKWFRFTHSNFRSIETYLE